MHSMKATPSGLIFTQEIKEEGNGFAIKNHD
jgi:hypothetical protein